MTKEKNEMSPNNKKTKENYGLNETRCKHIKKVGEKKEQRKPPHHPPKK